MLKYMNLVHKMALTSSMTIKIITKIIINIMNNETWLKTELERIPGNLKPF